MQVDWCQRFALQQVRFDVFHRQSLEAPVSFYSPYSAISDRTDSIGIVKTYLLHYGK
jgi:hypothetical protein